MSKVIRMWMMVAVIAATLGGILGYSTVHADTPTPVPPSVKLSMTKTALAPEVVPGGLISYTITVTNSGFAHSDAITLTDVLPSGAHWTANDREGCTLNDNGKQVLSCKFSLAPRHLNDSQTDFVNPSFAVTLYGIAGECGQSYTNQALATHDGDVLITNPVTIKTTACPTPTATPTAVPTQTPQPTATVVPPTQTPQIVYVEVTPTPKPVPLAPKTGNTQGTDGETNWFLLITVLLVVAGIAIAGTWYLFRDTVVEDDSAER